MINLYVLEPEQMNLISPEKWTIVLISGEGAFPEKPLTPPSSFPDLPLDFLRLGTGSFGEDPGRPGGLFQR